MYEDNEVTTSRKYLKEVIATINEPIVVLGGWAIYYLVNTAYKETTGREYIGSRDIDLGFTIPPDGIENSAFTKALTKLEDEPGFKPLSFRLFKQTHLETGESISPEEAKNTPSYMIFPMYIDMIVDKIPEGFAERFGFTPIDEPLLRPVFADPENRTEINEFNKQLWLPSPNMMLAMKIKSYPGRTKDHKRIKDIADIVALILFSSIKREDGMLLEHLTAVDIELFMTALTPGDIERVAEVIGMDKTLVESSIRQIIKRS
ncbi:MAG: hypothetical protein QCI38_02290 [Candidatus Thermoplasmatota archaeon]|nr:hypothetical protein [Candidatus Thermoplasmatota archaeon]